MLSSSVSGSEETDSEILKSLFTTYWSRHRSENLFRFSLARHRKSYFRRSSACAGSIGWAARMKFCSCCYLFQGV